MFLTGNSFKFCRINRTVRLHHEDSTKLSIRKLDGKYIWM